MSHKLEDCIRLESHDLESEYAPCTVRITEQDLSTAVPSERACDLDLHLSLEDGETFFINGKRFRFEEDSLWGPRVYPVSDLQERLEEAAQKVKKTEDDNWFHKALALQGKKDTQAQQIRISTPEQHQANIDKMMAEFNKSRLQESLITPPVQWIPTLSNEPAKAIGYVGHAHTSAVDSLTLTGQVEISDGVATLDRQGALSVGELPIYTPASLLTGDIVQTQPVLRGASTSFSVVDEFGFYATKTDLNDSNFPVGVYHANAPQPISITGAVANSVSAVFNC